MKDIVYFLGAGFSVPAGLPIISNFLFKAKNQYFENTEKFKYFESVFNYIDSLSKAKNFVNIDLFNIEEIYSIASIHELIKEGIKHNLEQFIKDVIIYHTPHFSRRIIDDLSCYSIDDKIFCEDEVLQNYIKFVSSMMHLEFFQDDDSEILSTDSIRGRSVNQDDVNYKIITLNYDKIIENSIEYINNYFKVSQQIPIVKLHGSVDTNIIPPTWNKILSNDINKHWMKAAEWLFNANEIRILGYSFPATDIYVKHLFSSSLVESRNLQKVDVLCLDNDGSVMKRYDDTFNFPGYSFYNIDLINYIKPPITNSYQIHPLKYRPISLEKCHNETLNNCSNNGIHLTTITSEL